MTKPKPLFPTINKIFSEIVDISCEGSEEYSESLRVFLSIDLKTKDTFKEKDQKVDRKAIEQWIKLSLQQTFNKKSKK